MEKKEVSKEKTSQSILPDLSITQKTTLLDLARCAIESYTRTGELISFETEDPLLKQHLGIFVTLRKKTALRGCIGTIKGQAPLFATLIDTAISAATKDPRFPPVSFDELEDLSIKISILSPLIQITDVDQIQVGEHGLMISQGGQRGVLLPQVAAERKWDRETYLNNLCQKAGLPSDAWRKDSELYLFSTLEF